MLEIGREVDRLAREVDDRGALAMKQPGVTGTGKRTAFQITFDKIMAGEARNFQPVIAGQVTLYDRAAAESQVAVGLAAGHPLAKAATSSPVSGPEGSIAQTGGAGDLLGQRTKVDAAAVRLGQPVKFSEAFGIDPATRLGEEREFLRTLQRYQLDNRGDDTADSPGYTPFELALKFSIQPGRLTRMGHGAELNITARPEFDADFTARTFRNLVINDLVNLLTPLVYNLLSHPGWEGPLEAFEDQYCNLERWRQLPEGMRFQLVMNLKHVANCLVPANQDLKMAYPISRSDLASVFMVENLARMARDCRPRVIEDAHELPMAQLVPGAGAIHGFKGEGTGRPRARPSISVLRTYLRQELESAYTVMSDPQSRATGLADIEFIDSVSVAIRDRLFEGGKDQRPDVQDVQGHEANVFAQMYPALMARLPGNLKQRMLGSLCWAIAVEAGLLDGQIRKEAARLIAAGHHDGTDSLESLRFYTPRPDGVTTQAFEDYVRRRWPVTVVSLDPSTDQQNIADSRQVTRDLQLAAAIAENSGKLGLRGLAGANRQVASSSDTVAQNRTITSFIHGNESFGWRFMPRYQNPQEPSSHLKAFAETVAAPLAFESRLHTARLEPGPRELTALILAPSILPRVRLETSTDWFRLDDPGRTVNKSGRSLELGREVQALRARLHAARDAGCFRPADVTLLATKLDELEARLPRQVCAMDLPYRNTLGGFELFTPGSTALLPELVGYEGVAVISPSGGDVLFLLGRNFDLMDTRVVIGGRAIAPADFDLISREILRVVVPPHIRRRIVPNHSDVEVFVATPNGVSNRLLIPCDDIPMPSAVLPAAPVQGPFHPEVTPGPASKPDPSPSSPAKVDKPVEPLSLPLPPPAPFPESKEKRPGGR